MLRSVLLLVLIKVAPNSLLASPASLLLECLRSAYGRQNGCSCARTHPQESLPDVSDWEARPMRGEHRRCGESREEGGVRGVISFRKMRHLSRPSHCGSFLFSFLVNNNDHHHHHPSTSCSESFSQSDPGARLNESRLSRVGLGSEVAGCRDRAV